MVGNKLSSNIINMVDYAFFFHAVTIYFLFIIKYLSKTGRLYFANKKNESAGFSAYILLFLSILYAFLPIGNCLYRMLKERNFEHGNSDYTEAS